VTGCLATTPSGRALQSPRSDLAWTAEEADPKLRNLKAGVPGPLNLCHRRHLWLHHRRPRTTGMRNSGRLFSVFRLSSSLPVRVPRSRGPVVPWSCGLVTTAFHPLQHLSVRASRPPPCSGDVSIASRLFPVGSQAQVLIILPPSFCRLHCLSASSCRLTNLQSQIPHPLHLKIHGSHPVRVPRLCGVRDYVELRHGSMDFIGF
jgi:hypothetical protein